MAARLYRARAPPAVRGLRRSAGSKRGHRGALSASSKSQSTVTAISKTESPPQNPLRPRSRAAHISPAPPAFLLPPSKPPTPVELDHTAHFCCSRASPLVCPNQSLCAEFDVLRRSRVLEGNERSALSYARAIAVSVILAYTSARTQPVCSTGYQRCPNTCPAADVHPLTVCLAFPRVITESERREVQKLPFIGTKVSKLVGCARSDLYASAYSG
jgi:hypothetical protein